ncbi:ankyrin repeat protein [Colletotrichum plurivorum]|uniref:Ankyrin repeat protein n=1 Tax=Colletotrichum plurivorum TaxID=2175906 RepID=A0A8H6JMC3_9PEZI|nr:ankyrin repeat protein [Colletotrichum plurivorum]
MTGSQHDSDEVYDMIYDEAMGRIDGQAPNLRHLGMEVLAWIVHAVRPLTATELNHALAVNLDDGSFDRDNIRDIEVLASVCAGLVTIDDASQTIRLVHYTTQEYFLRRKDRFFPGAHDRMASVCIKYLRFAYDELSNTGQDVKADKPGLYPFYQHSIYAWAYHAGRSAQLNNDVLSFLLNAGIMETLSTIYPTGRRLPVTGTGWAAYGGMKEAIYFFHTHEYDLDAPDAFGRTPLFYAAKAGHYDVAKLLCDLGATVTPWHRQAFFPSNTTRWSSPEATTEAGNDHSSSSELSTTITRKDSGESLATRRTHSTIEFEVATSSLWVVADFRSNLDIARLLLEQGASVDAKNNSGQTSLVVACKEGNTALLDLLLDKGASVDAEDYYGSTPLLVAVVNGHSSCAYKLLQRGARFRTTEQGHKALTLATRLGDALLVNALLDVGAPIALDASRGRNLLIIAAERDDAEVARLLVSRGADTELPDASGRTALACAAQMGHFETARALIEGGADVQTTDCNCQAPLSLACAFSGGGPGKHLTTIRLLVEKGARVNARCHAGCTALFWATRDGGPLRAGEPDDVIRFLIGAGADIEFLRRRAQEVRRTTLLRA